MKWPVFSDMTALKIIFVCAFILWPIVGCDKPATTQPTGRSNPGRVEVSTQVPVATATLQAKCLFGPAIMGCEN